MSLYEIVLEIAKEFFPEYQEIYPEKLERFAMRVEAQHEEEALKEGR